MLGLFDILYYSCKVWGFNKGTEVEKLHKRLLGVKQSTCNIMVYSELGRIPLEYMHLFRIIKYWFKLHTTTNCILKEAYNVLLDLSDGNTVIIITG